MRCRAPLTALLFLERMSSEGTLSRSSSRMDIFSGRDEIEELMMEAYQSIDESDGNAAFDKGLDLASVASAYERDEEWWRALGLFDVCMTDNCTSTKGECTLHSSGDLSYQHQTNEIARVIFSLFRDLLQIWNLACSRP